jgi:PHP domain
MPSRSLTLLAATLLSLVFPADPILADALARLKPERLEAVHQAVLELNAKRRDVERPGPYRDFRTNLHVHSAFSHDSRGKIDDIVTAAKEAGTSIVMFTEHPADHYDFFKEGHQGIKEGILLIPGAELKGFLVYPTFSLRGVETGSPQELSDLVRGRGGLMFVAHLEERMEWEIRGVTGVEIYNTHADFKGEKNLIAAMRNPLWLFQSADLFRKYPQEAFSALLDYPADYLARWDKLCEQAPHTGVSANDAHQNVGLVLRLVEGDKVQVEDALGEKLTELGTASNPLIQPLLKDKKVGDPLFELRVDRYVNSLRHVGTHLLLKEQTQAAVWDALEAGRAFVSFDWLADATGFDFAAVTANERHEMGSRITLTDGMKLRSQSPLNAHWKLIRNGGKPILESFGSTFETALTEPGNYRVELWLDIAGERQIWVMSNPIYVVAAAR